MSRADRYRIGRGLGRVVQEFVEDSPEVSRVPSVQRKSPEERARAIVENLALSDEEQTVLDYYADALLFPPGDQFRSHVQISHAHFALMRSGLDAEKITSELVLKECLRPSAQGYVDVTLLGYFKSKFAIRIKGFIVEMLDLIREHKSRNPEATSLTMEDLVHGLALDGLRAKPFHILLINLSRVAALHRGGLWILPNDIIALSRLHSADDLLIYELSKALAPEPPPHTATKELKMAEDQPDPKKVFVIHGRNEAAKKEMGKFLKGLGLTPVFFEDVRSKLGSPTVIEVVEKGMRDARGAVVLCTPDEYAGLDPQWEQAHDKPEDKERLQPRPNVLLEGGMALARDRNRVVFVMLGGAKLPSDLSGVHVFYPTKDYSKKSHRALLRDTFHLGLKCDVDLATNDWHEEGDFESCVKLPGVSPRHPFR